MTTQEQFLFAYGTLLNPEVQRAVIGREIAGEPDRLIGYRKTTLRDGDATFPDLTPDPSATVPGRVLVLTNEELRRTDLYEDVLYQRVEVTLQSGSHAWVYHSPK